MITTRGRYALRVLLDLARHGGDDFVPMRDVAERQEISLKYLEQILPLLKRGGLVLAAPGRRGGYRLARPPEQCRVSEILRLTEGECAPVACLAPDASPCPRRKNCATLPMWQALAGLMDDFFSAITLHDLAQGIFPALRLDGEARGG